MFVTSSPSTGFKKQKGLSELQKRKYEGSPLAYRDSALTLQARPEPSVYRQMLIQENVNREHESSSEDDLVMDRQFKEQSIKHTQDVMSNLQDWQLEMVEENIREHKYQMEKRKGNINDKTLRDLGYRKEVIDHTVAAQRTTTPTMPAIEVKHVGKSTFANRNADKYKITQRKYESVSTKRKLVKAHIPLNNKELDLLQQKVYGETYLYSSDDESNVKRTGLPQIKKFYKKQKQLEKRI